MIDGEPYTLRGVSTVWRRGCGNLMQRCIKALSTLAYNLQQREIILPSEKAFAYKYKFEAMKSKGKRNDLTSHQVGEKLERKLSVMRVAEDSSDSMNQILRFVRLTNLSSQMLEKVDEKKLSFVPAVELSYLKKEEQNNLFDILNREENFSVPLKQATMLKGISQNGDLSYEKIDKIITQKMKQPSKVIKLSYKKIKEYFPQSVSPKEIENVVVKALKAWFGNDNKMNLEDDIER